MQDIYLMNKETGELEPSQNVIRNWYNNHAWNTSWCDEWQETNLLVENSSVQFPNFANLINI